jgi:hypothetical protein
MNKITGSGRKYGNKPFTVEHQLLHHTNIQNLLSSICGLQYGP